MLMEEKRNQAAKHETTGRHPTPGERAARTLLAVVRWIKDCVSSFGVTRPEGRVVEHRGQRLPNSAVIKFPKILIVEDNLQTARELSDIIRHYYVYGDISIYLAYSYNAAVIFFSREVIDLVIMDSELEDEQGDGMLLTQKFLSEKPGIAILANSSSKISNLKMEFYGAAGSIGKSYTLLQKWLLENDRAGAGR